MEVQEKILPASVINDHVNQRVAELLENEGVAVSKSQRKLIKEEVTDKLLSLAFVKKSHILGVITKQYLIVDTGSVNKATEFESLLRRTLGLLMVEPLSSKVISKHLTYWATGADMPGELEKTGWYMIQSASGHDKAVLASEEDDLIDHFELAENMAVTGMSVLYNDSLCFDIHDDFSVKKINYFIKNEEEFDSEEAECDAQAELTVSELSGLFDYLQDIFAETG